jgi:hypothetical protein
MGQQGIVHAEHAHDQEGISMRVLMWVWILIQIGIVIQGLLVIGYLLARLVVGERWDIVAFANNFVPWIAAVGLSLSVIALLSRYRWALIALQMPGIVVFLVLYGELFLPGGSTAQQAGGPELTVATYNTLG